MTKKKHNPFLISLFILFIVYISLFIATKNGYYENKKKEEVIITEKNLKKFENDIKEGKNIDLYDYTTNQRKDYRGFASNMGDDFSNFVEDIATDKLLKIGKFLKKMFS